MGSLILRGELPTWLLLSFGYGYGYGFGYGYGYGNGDGNGNGYGYGDGNGYGYGNGNGNGYGDGDGDGYGNGYGYGFGEGYGNGDGNGNGEGYGYGDETHYYWAQNIAKQIAGHHRFDALRNEGCLLAYWRSNADGTPANGGSGTKAKPGLVEEISGPLEICTERGLHATLNPPKWNGEKLWIVALYPPFQFDDDKVASLKREIICEADFTL